MAKKTKKRRLNSRLMRTVRKTSAAVLMATAIAVAAIPAGNIEAQDRETNTGVVVNDTRKTYVYLRDVSGVDKDDRNDVYKDSQSDPGTYYKKINSDKLATYHRLEVNKENGSSPGPVEGLDFQRSYSVRKNSQGYYLNWQFAFDLQGVLCKYNDSFAEDIVELPYQVATEYYTISLDTYDNFYSEGHTGSQELTYTFDQWNSEDDKKNPIKGDGFIIHKYFPTRMTNFISTCQTYLDNYNKEQEEWENKLTELQNRLLNETDQDTRNQIQNEITLHNNNAPVILSSRTDKPELKINPSDANAGLSLQDKYKYFCDFFVPATDGANDHDKHLKSLSSYSTDSAGFSLEYVYDESDGTSRPVYLVKYLGTEKLGLRAETDAFGFLITGFPECSITAIGDYAFYNVKSIDTLILPEEILYIGDYAFASSFMKTIQMPNIKKIGNAAFKGCGKLTNITFSTGRLEVIGTEAFYGTPLTELKFPYCIQQIGYGAFAECTSLKKIDMSEITEACTIYEAAFYDAMSLTELTFPPETSKAITELGDGTFAVELTNANLRVELPANLASLPEYLFAGRTNLLSVTMPVALGYKASTNSIVPNTTFVGCRSLQYVKFPNDSKYVHYQQTTTYTDADGNTQAVFPLYLDVDNKDFYVEGPAYSTGTVEALERVDTWNCITNVNNFVPYVYQLDGVMYYEVSDGKYVMTANENGVLLTCRVIDDGTSLIDLVIPQKVGNYTIKTIADGCFNDEKLRARLRSITVENGTLQEISAGVFKNLPKLKWVDLGDSVEKIGDSAFEGCEALTDVTFRADQVTLGANAFVTHGDELTFHGKIASDFGPFVWAMQKDNLVKANGVRVCYQSLSPSLLTVMYDDGTDLVTLVDYPKYNDLDELHKQDSIDYWYAAYASSQYDDLRADFYELWKAAVNSSDKETEINKVYGNDAVYGPWINPKYCEDVVDKLVAEPPTTSSGAMNSGNAIEKVFDTVFPAITALAADGDKPKAYFDHPDHQYSIENKAASASGKVWDEYTTDENAWIDACLNLVIPSGVQSIDAKGYFTNTQKNGTNIATYFSDESRISAESLHMYKSNHTAGADGKEVIPGTFSGYYSDYGDGTDKDTYEVSDRGNDRILSVTMTDVLYLPDMAFDSCERLERVVLGSALSDIGSLPFYGCTNLKDVVGNDNYIYSNGLVYGTQEAGDGTYTIIECLPGRGDVVGSATVPDDTNSADVEAVKNTSRIAERAFEDCDNIRIVNLFDSTVSTIPERCFEDCDNLDMVYLPHSTNSIKSEAFKNDKTVTVSIPSKEVFIATNAFVHGPNAKRDPEDGKVKFNTYPDSAAAEYAQYYDINLQNMATTHTVWFNDYNGIPLITKPFYVKDGDIIAGDERPAEPTRTGYEFDKWISNNGIPVDGRIYEDVVFTATYIPIEGSHDGKYYIDLLDGVTGEKIGERLLVDPDSDATGLLPTPPTHDGYSFVKWSSEAYKKVTEDLILTALYAPGSSGNGSNNSGGSNSGGSNSGGSSNSGSSGSSDNSGSSGSSDSNSSSSDSSTQKKYKVTVENGTGNGDYYPGNTVIITASNPPAGKVFSKWTTESQGVNFTNAGMMATTFKMPSNDVTVKATYVDSASTTTPVAGTTQNTLPPGYGDGYGTNNNQKPEEDTNAQVTVSKPGISNIDLATAKVNGSSDSFVIKVTETNEAEEKVRSALTNRYGSLDNRIEYWSCDISLYDETGNTKIEDTTGLTVDITLPVPDELRQYGTNNMVGAVAEGSLESLTPRFNEINGVPCVTFTATHFSPYTIYVDTQNLVASQMLDATPKTGDPIHPKWFLSIGLACVSILLFMKKDKKVNRTLKTA